MRPWGRPSYGSQGRLRQWLWCSNKFMVLEIEVGVAFIVRILEAASSNLQTVHSLYTKLVQRL